MLDDVGLSLNLPKLLVQHFATLNEEGEKRKKTEKVDSVGELER